MQDQGAVDLVPGEDPVPSLHMVPSCCVLKWRGAEGQRGRGVEGGGRRRKAKLSWFLLERALIPPKVPHTQDLI